MKNHTQKLSTSSPLFKEKRLVYQDVPDKKPETPAGKRELPPAIPPGKIGGQLVEESLDMFEEMDRKEHVEKIYNNPKKFEREVRYALVILAKENFAGLPRKEWGKRVEKIYKVVKRPEYKELVQASIYAHEYNEDPQRKEAANKLLNAIYDDLDEEGGQLLAQLDDFKHVSATGTAVAGRR